jgi:hypothetical protein
VLILAAQATIGSEGKSRFGKTLAAAVVDDAPKLARGEAWFIADDDAFGDVTPEPRKIQFRLRRTFDSSRPPRIGEASRSRAPRSRRPTPTTRASKRRTSTCPRGSNASKSR